MALRKDFEKRPLFIKAGLYYFEKYKHVREQDFK